MPVMGKKYTEINAFNYISNTEEKIKCKRILKK